MSFTFDPDHMKSDLDALAKTASGFWAPQSLVRVHQLSSALEMATANAARTGKLDFLWATPVGQPIQLKESKCWKGGSGKYSPMIAEITLDYSCTFIPEKKRVLVNGVIVLSIQDLKGGAKKVVHFDAEEGGWTEKDSTGIEIDRAGHPPFHAQFHGSVNDIPRTPSLLVHPVDVINFAILELHQKTWRVHLNSASARSQARYFPTRQRQRLTTILQEWTSVISDTHNHALVAMQRPLREPIAL